MMKKYFRYAAVAVLAVAAVFAVTSCSDRDDDVRRLEIVESDVAFGPEGGTGRIVLTDVPEGVTALEGWCQVTTEGNTVTVRVGRWQSLESRNAVITVNGGGTTVNVPVYQEGAVWSLLGEETYDIGSDDATEVTIPMRIDFDYTVRSSAPEWLDGEMTEAGYRVRIGENNSGARRRAELTFSSELGERTYVFVQFGLRVIEGRYRATFGNNPDNLSETVVRETEIRLVDREKNLFGIYGLCDDPNIYAVVEYDPATHDFTLIPGQQYQGGETVYDGQRALGYCAIMGLNNDRWLSTYTPFTQTYIFTMDEDRGKPTFAFTDNGSWNGLAQSGFRIDLMPNQYPSDYNKLATLVHVFNMSLVKE